MRIHMTSVFVDDPIRAHAFYTEVLGFRSRHFDPDVQLAIVVSAEDPEGTELLLEPRGDGFAKSYQETLFQQGLPTIVFGTADLRSEIDRLQGAGVRFREDLAKPQWGLDHLFEDGFGNLIMLQQVPSSEA